MAGRRAALEDIVRAIITLPAPLLWLTLLLAAGLEYVLPPFPGDAVVMGGGIVAGLSGGIPNFLLVFGAVTAGSVLGAWLDYEIGRWLRRPGASWLHRWMARPRVVEPVRRIQRLFQHRGDFLLVINRFLPGLRAFFFITAGLSGLSRARTLLLATFAALLWNALMIGVGVAVGANLDAILHFLDQYSRVAWIVVGAVAVGAGIVFVATRPRQR